MKSILFVWRTLLRIGIQPLITTIHPQGSQLVWGCQAEMNKSTLIGDQSLTWHYVASWRWYVFLSRSLLSSIIWFKGHWAQLKWSWRILEKQIHILYSQLDQQLCNSKFPWGLGFDFLGLSPQSGISWSLYLISSLAKVSRRLAIILEEMLSLYLK